MSLTSRMLGPGCGSFSSAVQPCEKWEIRMRSLPDFLDFLDFSEFICLEDGSEQPDLADLADLAHLADLPDPPDVPDVPDLPDLAAPGRVNGTSPRSDEI